MPIPKQGFKWSAGSDVGRFRKNNEDAFLALTFDAHQVQYLGKYGTADFTSGDFVFAVSDGMGGANAGEFASRIAVQKITDIMPKSFRLGVEGFERGELDFLVELISSIHKEMVWMGINYEEVRGMGATLTLCWLTPDKSFFAHVGDSRLYYLPTGTHTITQVSEDHTHVGWLFRQGKITAFQARTHPGKNLLQQSLGGESQHIDPQLGSFEFESGDKWVLCSDGISDGISDTRIETLINTPPPPFQNMEPADRLIREARDEYGKDNLTAIVIEVM